MKQDKYRSWGRTQRLEHDVIRLQMRPSMSNELPLTPKAILPYGFGRSYGDSCQNGGGVLLDTTALDHFIEFDPITGVVSCESGVSLAHLLDVCLPRGWFLPVTPGSKFVSVGGAVANDVHGKNHHVAGTFGCHVRSFSLIRSDGEFLCSPMENVDLFRATIGGMGLTGLITTVELQMRAVTSQLVDMEQVKFKNLSEFYEVADESDNAFEYTVAWVDCLASGKELGRGLFIRGNHAKGLGPSDLSEPVPRPNFSVPMDAPETLLNKYSIKAFNAFYYGRQQGRLIRRKTHFNPFFYPLDAVDQWNRIYGKRGFFQYQFVLPVDRKLAIREVFERIVATGRGSFLAVLKKFGDIPSPGMMSFPVPGITLALDFANRGAETVKFLRSLDLFIVENGGRVYPAKDATMTASSFQAFFPMWNDFSKFIDPRFSSSFWRRVTQDE